MTITSTAQGRPTTATLPAGPRPTALQLLRQADAGPASSLPAPDPQATPLALPRQFTAAQCAALAAPLNRANVRQREQGRTSVSYLEGWKVIAEANRIFGFDGWERQTVFCSCVAQAERRIGRDQKPGWGVTYIARVRITVGFLVREGTGAGHGIDVDLGQAHESAIKEAETDAMKRALMTFGNPFGLALYDKRQRQVSETPDPQEPSGSRDRSRPDGTPTPANTVVRRPQRETAPVAAASRTIPQPAVAPDAPLDPPTIRSLQERIKALLPPQLEAFRRAFRSAFQVPDSTPSIAGLITEQRHRLWIQRYLSGAHTQPA